MKYSSLISVGEKMMYAPLSTTFRDQGYLLVVPNYASQSSNRLPGMLRNIVSSIQWTKAHIQEYGGDPSRIYLMGHFVGAHLAALTLIIGAMQNLALNNNLKEATQAVLEKCPDIAVDLGIKGAILLNGVYDLDVQHRHEKEAGKQEHSVHSMMMGDSFLSSDRTLLSVLMVVYSISKDLCTTASSPQLLLDLLLEDAANPPIRPQVNIFKPTHPEPPLKPQNVLAMMQKQLAQMRINALRMHLPSHWLVVHGMKDGRVRPSSSVGLHEALLRLEISSPQLMLDDDMDHVHPILCKPYSQFFFLNGVDEL